MAILPDQLSGDAIKQLVKGILHSYRGEGTFAYFLRVNLNRHFDQITRNELQIMIFYLIEKAEREGWLWDLIKALHWDQPQNGMITDVHQICCTLLGIEQETAKLPTVIQEGYRLTIHLRYVMGGCVGWGEEQGKHIANLVQDRVEAHSGVRIVRLSLRYIEGIDVTFASGLVELVRSERGERGYCLIDIHDQDIIPNIDAAAHRYHMPLFAWNVDEWTLLGPESGIGQKAALLHTLSVPQTTASEVMSSLHLSVQNASNKLRQLWLDGYVLREERSAASGGMEYIYMRIH